MDVGEFGTSLHDRSVLKPLDTIQVRKQLLAPALRRVGPGERLHGEPHPVEEAAALRCKGET